MPAQLTNQYSNDQFTFGRSILGCMDKGSGDMLMF